MSEPLVHMQFGLPILPPPLHACFKNVRKHGRADTARYLAFKWAIDTHIQAQPWWVSHKRFPIFAMPVRVHFVLRRPDNRRRDLDNLNKALCDSLVRNSVLGDDSQIVDLRIGWTLEEMKEPVLVQVEAA